MVNQIDTRILFSIQCDDHIQSLITNLEKMLKDNVSEKLKTCGKRAATSPFPQTYCPECDTSKELDKNLASNIYSYQAF